MRRDENDFCSCRTTSTFMRIYFARRVDLLPNSRTYFGSWVVDWFLAAVGRTNFFKTISITRSQNWTSSRDGRKRWRDGLPVPVWRPKWRLTSSRQLHSTIEDGCGRESSIFQWDCAVADLRGVTHLFFTWLASKTKLTDNFSIRQRSPPRRAVILCGGRRVSAAVLRIRIFRIYFPTLDRAWETRDPRFGNPLGAICNLVPAPLLPNPRICNLSNKNLRRRDARRPVCSYFILSKRRFSQGENSEDERSSRGSGEIIVSTGYPIPIPYSYTLATNTDGVREGSTTTDRIAPPRLASPRPANVTRLPTRMCVRVCSVSLGAGIGTGTGTGTGTGIGTGIGIGIGIGTGTYSYDHINRMLASRIPFVAGIWSFGSRVKT